MPLDLPVRPPIRPMLAKLVDHVPSGDYLYEPKWDGYRCLVFRCDDELSLQSREGKPLLRFFPDLEEPLLDELPDRCVLDGEIVIVREGRLDFEALLQRNHPGRARIAKLAETLPASYVAFDLLAFGDDDHRRRPFRDRRALLEAALSVSEPPVHVTPITADRDQAIDWFHRFEGAGFDGVIAKPAVDGYAENKRSQLKIKHVRTADCVVGGYRMDKSGDGVGSLLLGLYDEADRLHHVGGASGFRANQRREILERLTPLELEEPDRHPWAGWDDDPPPADDVRRPGNLAGWSSARDESWVPVELELVVEVRYDHLQGDRFRNVTRFLRWRPDRDPESCRYEQLEQVPPVELRQLFG